MTRASKAGKEGSQGCTRACFPPTGHGPRVVAAGKEGGMSARAVMGRGRVCRQARAGFCVSQLVNCSAPVTAERAIELRGVIIYEVAQRCLPGTGMG